VRPSPGDSEQLKRAAAVALDARGDEYRYKRDSASVSASMAECLICETAGKRATFGWCNRYSRRQLLANAAIAASRVVRIAMRRRAVLVVPEGERPHP
jgi:hypothetical protein